MSEEKENDTARDRAADIAHKSESCRFPDSSQILRNAIQEVRLTLLNLREMATEAAPAKLAYFPLSFRLNKAQP